MIRVSNLAGVRGVFECYLDIPAALGLFDCQAVVGWGSSFFCERNARFLKVIPPLNVCLAILIKSIDTS